MTHKLPAERWGGAGWGGAVSVVGRGGGGGGGVRGGGDDAHLPSLRSAALSSARQKRRSFLACLFGLGVLFGG